MQRMQIEAHLHERLRRLVRSPLARRIKEQPQSCMRCCSTAFEPAEHHLLRSSAFLHSQTVIELAQSPLEFSKNCAARLQKYWVATTSIRPTLFTARWLTSSCGRAVGGVVGASGRIDASRSAPQTTKGARRIMDRQTISLGRLTQLTLRSLDKEACRAAYANRSSPS